MRPQHNRKLNVFIFAENHRRDELHIAEVETAHLLVSLDGDMHHSLDGHGQKPSPGVQSAFLNLVLLAHPRLVFEAPDVAAPGVLTSHVRRDGCSQKTEVRESARMLLAGPARLVPVPLAVVPQIGGQADRATGGARVLTSR